MFVIVAYEDGYINGAQYVVGATACPDNAVQCALSEYELRRGSYGVAVYCVHRVRELVLYKYLPSRRKEARPHLGSELCAAQVLGGAVLQQARRDIASGDIEHWPQWLLEEVDFAMRLNKPAQPIAGVACSAAQAL